MTKRLACRFSFRERFVIEEGNQHTLYMRQLHVNGEKLRDWSIIDAWFNVEERAGASKLPGIVSVKHIAPHGAEVLFFSYTLRIGGCMEAEIDADSTSNTRQITAQLSLA
jgi:hypothetical protein